MGYSMGGMHTSIWGTRYPDAMEALGADGGAAH